MKETVEGYHRRDHGNQLEVTMERTAESHIKDHRDLWKIRWKPTEGYYRRLTWKGPQRPTEGTAETGGRLLWKKLKRPIEGTVEGTTEDNTETYKRDHSSR